MPIYDNDGTANREIAKVYDNNGSANAAIKEVYDNDGSANRLIYKDVITGVLYNNGSHPLTNLTQATNGYTDRPTITFGNTIAWANIGGRTSFGTAAICQTAFALQAGQTLKATFVPSVWWWVNDTNTTHYSVFFAMALLTSVPAKLDFDSVAQYRKYQYVEKGADITYYPATGEPASWNMTPGTITLTVKTAGTFYPALFIAGYDCYAATLPEANNWIIAT